MTSCGARIFSKRPFETKKKKKETRCLGLTTSVIQTVSSPPEEPVLAKTSLSLPLLGTYSAGCTCPFLIEITPAVYGSPSMPVIRSRGWFELYLTRSQPLSRSSSTHLWSICGAEGGLQNHILSLENLRRLTRGV